MASFNIIVATDKHNGTSVDGCIVGAGTPHARMYFEWFRTIVTDQIVIIGRRAYDQLSGYLPNCMSVVIENNIIGSTIGVLTKTPLVVVQSFDAALLWIANAQKVNFVGSTSKRVYVCGGNNVFAVAIKHPLCNGVLVNKLPIDDKCDKFLPVDELVDTRIGTNSIRVHMGNNHGNAVYSLALIIRYTFFNEDETAYLKLLQSLLNAPIHRNRTGVPTRTLFAQSLRFRLTDYRGMVIPLMTTKDIPFKSIITELLWFLRADTNTDFLHSHGVKIWDANTTRKALDARGLVSYSVGDTGPIYGCQWRNWNGVNIDQIQRVIATLRTDPWDRRMIVSAWNPEKIDQMCLPACHCMFQFHVSPNMNGDPKILNCIVNMRSADVVLGVPFNVASYATLTHIIATLTGMHAGELVISMADCHIYENHVDGIHEQLKRNPRRFPTLGMNQSMSLYTSIDSFTNADPNQYTVNGYMPHPRIKFEMAI